MYDYQASDNYNEFECYEDDFAIGGGKPAGKRKNKNKSKAKAKNDQHRNKPVKMGQDSSTPIDESVPSQTLETRTVDGVAKYIKSGRCKRIVVMTGAGISTSAGIPDFRSPDTGLYANLARLNLPYAEAVFDISYFKNNPYPFYTLAHELYPGKYRPTITHSFLALLQKKGLLHMLFTQNIDCLEREAGVSGDKIVEAHGSFATQRCVECARPFPADRMREMVGKKEVPHCVDEACMGLVKPDIVFFGEALPKAFFENKSKPAEADLAIVLGTSLTVQPFASLPQIVSEGTPRVLINLERVGGLGSRADDVLVLGDCDKGVCKLANALGWLGELIEEWEKTAPRVAAELLQKTETEQEKTKDEKLQDEIDKLTQDVDETLKISNGHRDFMEKHLGQKAAKSEKQLGESAAPRNDEKDHPPAVDDTTATRKLGAGISNEGAVAQESKPSAGGKTSGEESKAKTPEGGGSKEDEGLDHVVVGEKGKSAL